MIRASNFLALKATHLRFGHTRSEIGISPAHYVTRQDIHLLREAGFNSIRVPMHYKFFESDTSEGFILLDRVVEWCRQEGLYVILGYACGPWRSNGREHR